MQNGFKLLFVLFQQVQVPKSCEREEDKEEEKGLVKFPMCSFTMFSIAPHFIS
jgi:hypothetical protein